MHIDESKKFDKRNTERNIKDKIITQKDYEIYLSKLADISIKIFIPDESMEEHEDFELAMEDGDHAKKRGMKKKAIKGKRK